MDRHLLRSPGKATRVRSLDGRRGFRLAGDWGHVTVLEGGGHFCELVSKRHGSINPLWRPPWRTMDPHLYDAGRHGRIYGTPPDGRLLAGIAGHNLSFDHFGPPSQEEAAAGLSTHGEASWRRWHLRPQAAATHPSLECSLGMTDAQIDVTRTISIEPRSPVVYIEETARSLTAFDRAISWNEHVTFGPPFLEAGVTTFDLPATFGKVCAASYSSRMFLRPDAEFRWPLAPSTRGRRIDLRKTSGDVYGRYTAQLVDPGLSLAWFAASNTKLGLMVLYMFRRADFPWIGNWEERLYRKTAPWNGKTFCRGMEFSTTPFAIPRRESVSQGALFGEPTYRWLPARSLQRVRYMIVLLDVANDFGGVAHVSMEKGVLRLAERGRHRRTITVRAQNFLQMSPRKS